MSISPIHSWTVFLVAVEYFQEESLCMLNFKSPLPLWTNADIRQITPRRRSRVFKRCRVSQRKPEGTMKVARIENAEVKVWCESCCIRVAPNEERTVVRGKTYHVRCYAKLIAKPKIDAPGVSA